MSAIDNILKPVSDIRKKELECYIKALNSRDTVPQNKFVIFAHYRTGSTLLQSLLNCHPKIRCERELFLDFMFLKYKKVFFPYYFVIGSLVKTKSSASGFVLRLDQLNKVLTRFHGSSDKFLHKLNSDGWKIIHLKRENHLRQAISNVTGLIRGRIHNRVDKPLNKTNVHIDPQTLIRTINWMENVSKKEDGMVEKLDHITIVYESDLLHATKHQTTSEKIFDYLGLGSHAVTARFRRISADDIFETIINAAEIEATIKNSRYDVYL